jgi:hypothetical protein
MSLLLMVSCNLNEKVTKKHRMPKYDFPDTKDYDTTGKSNGDLPDDVTNNIETLKNKKVTITSSNIVYESFPYEHIKIIEVPNTKVIKQSSDLSEGRLVYKIPNVMRIRSTYKVFVRISKSRATVSIYDSLSGEVMTSKIPITETMEVKLIDLSVKGKKSFEIVDGNNGIQIIESGDTYTEWSWSVTPIRMGNTKLKIIVSVIRNNNKKDIVYEDTVEIERDIKEQLIFFWEEYWKWIISTFISPFIVWWWKNRKKKKSKDEDNNENEEEDGKGKTV